MLFKRNGSIVNFRVRSIQNVKIIGVAGESDSISGPQGIQRCCYSLVLYS